MDKRIFLALMALASAAASPALAEQARMAHETGQLRHVSRIMVLEAIYRVSLSGNTGLGAKAIARLGHSPGEAEQMAGLAASIAMKAGSFDAFQMLADGRIPKGAKLTAREMALLRSVTAHGGPSAGIAGRTWEGSAMASIHTKLDGRTWEGSSM